MIGFIVCFVLGLFSMGIAYDEYAAGKIGSCTAFAAVGGVFFYMAGLVVT